MIFYEIFNSRELDFPLFIAYNRFKYAIKMNRENINSILNKVEQLIEDIKVQHLLLKNEINSEVKDPSYEVIKNYLIDYDEIYDPGEEV